MNNRRSLLRGLISTAAITQVMGQEHAGVQIKSRQKLSGALDGMEATVVEVSYPPGASSPQHRHPGFIAGYVLEGRIRFGVEGQPEQILSTGETFFEAAGALHSVSANAQPDKPARILAFSVAPAGSPVALPK